MAIHPGISIAAKRAWLESMRGDTFKVALYDSSASLSPLTETYTPAGEVKGKGYKAGGQVLRGVQIGVDGVTACMTFESLVWPNSTITAGGAMVYNASRGNIVMSVVSFDQDITSTNGNWKLPMPSLGATESVIRIS